MLIIVQSQRSLHWAIFFNSAYYLINQLIFYISFHDFFAPNQYGFWTGKNTTDRLVDLIEQITKSVDNGEFAITLFLDLSKALDTDSVIFSKEYKQFMWMMFFFSDIQVIKVGVPQGSVHGPIFFYLY